MSGEAYDHALQLPPFGLQFSPVQMDRFVEGVTVKSPPILLFIVVMLALMGCDSSDVDSDDRSVSDGTSVEHENEPQESNHAEETVEQAHADEADIGLVLDEASMEEWGKGKAYRGQVELSGHLRFSWLTVWNDVDEYEKKLVMRFFADDAGQEALPVAAVGEPGEYPPVITLYDERDMQQLVDVDTATMQTVIDEDFDDVPKNFETFEEGHVQQAGTLVMEGLLVETMADQPYYFGRFVSFESRASDEDAEALQTRLDAQAYAAGPQHGPAYEEHFYLTEPGVLYTEPDEESDRVADVEAQQLLVKTRTVDAHWYEVSLRSDEETTGFVRRDLLAPVN